MTKRIPPILPLVSGIALATAGFFLIGFSCSYTFVSTIMTGRIMVPGIWGGVPYKWILAVAVYLILYAFYDWTRRKNATHATKPAADPLLLMSLSMGVAVVGFLATNYPCPVPIDPWLILMLEVHLGAIGIPYAAILALAIGLLLYAGYAHTKKTRAENSPDLQ